MKERHGLEMKNANLTLSFSPVEQYSYRRFHEAMRIYRAEFSHDTGLPIPHIRALLQAGTYQLLIGQHEQQVLENSARKIRIASWNRRELYCSTRLNERV